VINITAEPSATSPRASAVGVEERDPVGGNVPPGGVSGQVGAAGARRAKPAGSPNVVDVVSSTITGLVVEVVVVNDGVVVVVDVVVVVLVVVVVVVDVVGGFVVGGFVVGGNVVVTHGIVVVVVVGAASPISNRTLSIASVFASVSTPIASHEAIQIADSWITATSVCTRLSPTSIVGPSYISNELRCSSCRKCGPSASVKVFVIV